MTDDIPLTDEKRCRCAAFARMIDAVPIETLVSEYGFERVDNSKFCKCPVCGELPTVLIESGKNAQGVARCCTLGIAIVSASPDKEPVTAESLSRSWTHACAQEKLSLPKIQET